MDLSVQLHVTGLEAPDSVADNTSTGGYALPTDCIAAVAPTTSYLAALQNHDPSITNIDGTIIQNSLRNTGRFAPCLKTTNLPTVNIGRATGLLVTDAGFVADSITGLYQVNV